MIKVENVVKTFDGFRALDGLSLNVPKGGIYGLVGPNGSGKSTVIRHITGIYRQDSGTVTVVVVMWSPVRSSGTAPRRLAARRPA